ncbi:MAG: DMT family transporter [Phycisphaerales bacterium]
MHLLWFLVAFIAGAVTPLQAGVNGALHRQLGHPLHATLTNFVVGAIVCTVLMLIMRVPLPSAAALSSAPWWTWLGGICGVILVMGSVLSVGPLGFGGLVMGILVGQVACSLLLDRSGLLSDVIREVTPARLAGVGMVVIGVAVFQLAGPPRSASAIPPSSPTPEIVP